MKFYHYKIHKNQFESYNLKYYFIFEIMSLNLQKFPRMHMKIFFYIS